MSGWNDMCWLTRCYLYRNQVECPFVCETQKLAPGVGSFL
jgi:hypothetical protein